MRKQLKLLFIPLILSITTYILTYGTIIDDNYNKTNEIDESISILDEGNTEDIEHESIEETIQYPEIARLDGYNSVLLNFYEKLDQSTIAALQTKLDVYSIYSKYDAFFSIDDAIESGVIRDFESVDEYSYSFLLKNGYKFNMKLNPYNKNIVGLSDDKANLPIELESTEYGNCQLNVFDITFDYKSKLLDVSVDPKAYS